MTLVYSFLERFIESLYLFLGDLLITFLGAFLGFLLALLSNKWIEDQKNQKDLKKSINKKYEALKHLESLAESVLNHILTQMRFFKECAERIRLQPLEIQIPQFESSDDLDRIKNLDKQYIISSFLHFYPTERNVISDLFSHIEFTDRRLKEAYLENERHIDFVQKDQLSIQEDIDLLSISTEISIMNYELELGEKVNDSTDFQYLRQVQKIFNNVVSVPPIDFDRLEKEYLLFLKSTLPIRLSNRKLLNEFYFIVRKTLNRIQTIKVNATMRAEQLIKIEQEFISTREKIELAISRLKEINAP
jgi:hypothetical protein